MAYNYFPATYQTPYYQQPQQAPANNGIIWVQGEAGAKSYMVAPNNTVQLWDSEAQVIYLKSADASGMPAMKVLDYTIRNDSPAPAPVSTGVSYATTEAVNALQSEIDGLRGEIEKLSVTRRRRREETDE